jgi:signal transduction histidine kinase/DNA-binding CsgD family transcriptional regulator
MTVADSEFGRDSLTPRQREIAASVARGLTNQQIAAELCISVGTAANHVQRTLDKLGLNSRAELAGWASRHGLAAADNRLLLMLQRLLEIVPQDLDAALDAATQAVADAVRAEKVDAFLYEASITTLVARGTSPTPLGRKQHSLGLHQLPLVNGGRMVEVFQTGTPRHAGRVDRDMGELRGIRVGLGVRSEISVPLEVGGQRRGVLSAVSTAPDFFTEGDLRFLATVGGWIGMVVQHAELVEQVAAEAAENARRAAAEELITILAHDFRNFLTPLRGRLDLLRRRARRDGHPQYVSDSEQLLMSVTRLERLVHDLLDAAQLNQGLFDLKCMPLDLAELARQTVAEFAPSADAVVVTAPTEEVLVEADASRLRQVVENLLSNALKVQPAHLPVQVHVEAMDSRAALHVADNGPGIASELLAQLFQRFGRGPESVGLGLGLYLARGITEAHGGSLEVQSRPGAGARFSVRLPLLDPGEL